MSRSNKYTQELKEQIKCAINATSSENNSDTPDFILAEFLVNCLRAFELEIHRSEYYEFGYYEASSYFTEDVLIAYMEAYKKRYKWHNDSVNSILDSTVNK